MSITTEQITTSQPKQGWKLPALVFALTIIWWLALVYTELRSRMKRINMGNLFWSSIRGQTLPVISILKK